MDTRGTPAAVGTRGGLGRLWLAGFLAALLLYAAALAPDLAWQDSGDYQYEAARLGLSRPGDAVRVHPWFIAAAHALGLVPIWNYARAANFASALGTALAAANVLLLVRLLTGGVRPAVVGAASFALGHAVWGHAVIAETYGWAAAFLSGEMLCAWAYLADRRPRWLVILFLVNGVAISNHVMAVWSLGVFAAWALVECLRGRVAARALAAAAACWLAGGTLYWIVLGMEYARTGSLAETLHSGLVGRWASNIFNVSDLPALLGRSALYVALNYPTPLILAIPLGAAAIGRRGGFEPQEIAQRQQAFARPVLALAAVYFLWAARYKVVDQYAFFVPFYVVASVLIGVGAAAVLDRRPRAAWALAAAALLPAAVYAALPAAAERAGYPRFPRELPYRNSYTYFLQPWKTCDSSARRYAAEVLDSLPPGAALVPDSTARPPLACVHDLEGRRPDVTIRGWERPGVGGRLFVTSDVPGYFPPWAAEQGRLVPFGLVWEVVPAPAKEEGR
ncbi:MAG: DUF2723 domain-containing protein [Planctomycetes bacterium]|nr:DUF2723 domain-containing protein [Planctomycetota bacterium]